MARLKKQRMKQKFNYSKDRKRSWKNKNKLPKIKCAQLQEAWDEKKSVEQNMLDMGLSSNSNKTLRIPTAKELLVHTGDAVKKLKSKEKKKALKQHVVDSLEIEASVPQEAKLRIPDPEIKYCIYMMEKYGDNFKAMARDSKNHYQDTPKQIRRKINKFKNSGEHYQTYLRTKVYLSPFPCVVTKSMAGSRRVTRKYEAGRRNGHYNDTPPRSGSGVSTASTERAFSRVKRKLQFGRKPPQKRDVTPTASTSSGTGKQKSKTKGLKASARRSGSTLSRELRSLLDSAVVILPVRLRSAMRARKRGKQAGYTLKRSPEGTNLNRKKSNRRRRSGEVITSNVYVD